MILAGFALGAAHFSGGVIPLADPALRTLLVGSLAIAPLVVNRTACLPRVSDVLNSRLASRGSEAEKGS